MKKYLKYFSLLLVVALVVTGCGNKKTENKDTINSESNVSLEEAIKNTFTEKSFKISSKTEFELSAEGVGAQAMNANASVELNGEIDKNNNMHAKISMKMTSNGETDTEDGEVYLDVNDKKQYANNAGEWYYESLDEENIDMLNKINPEQVTKYIKESKKVDTDKEGYDKYEVSFDVLKALEEVAGDEIAEIKDAIEVPDLKINMYVKGKYVAFVTYDLGDQLKGILNNIITLMYTTNGGNGSTNVPKINLVLKGSIEITDVGNVEVKVPDEVKNNAKEDVVYNNNQVAEVKTQR